MALVSHKTKPNHESRNKVCRGVKDDKDFRELIESRGMENSQNALYMYETVKIIEKENKVVISNIAIFNFSIVSSFSFSPKSNYTWFLFCMLTYLSSLFYQRLPSHEPLHTLSSQNRLHCSFPNDRSNFFSSRFIELFPCQFIIIIIVSSSTNTVIVHYLGCNFTIIFGIVSFLSTFLCWTKVSEAYQLSYSLYS